MPPSEATSARQSLGAPDPFRMQYRPHIAQAVAIVVREKLNTQQAISKIRRFAQKQIAALDREPDIAYAPANFTHGVKSGKPDPGSWHPEH